MCLKIEFLNQFLVREHKAWGRKEAGLLLPKTAFFGPLNFKVCSTVYTERSFCCRAAWEREGGREGGYVGYTNNASADFAPW